jgi:hypothetical protein
MTDTNVFQLSQPGTFADPLTEVLRNGARTLLTQAVEAEIVTFLSYLDPRRALWPAVMRTALTGRTHGCTDQACEVRIPLANPEPSTHGTHGKCRCVRFDAAFGG